MQQFGAAFTTIIRHLKKQIEFSKQQKLNIDTDTCVNLRTVIDTARFDEPARNPCRLSISWTSQVPVLNFL